MMRQYGPLFKRLFNRIANLDLRSGLNIYDESFCIKEIETDALHNFCGYYTNNPFSTNGDYILIHDTNCASTAPQGVCRILLYSIRDKSYKVIGSTKSWNWQQGAMAQWIGEDIIYNTYDENIDCYVSVLVDMNGKELRRYNYPVYKVAPNNNYFIGLDFRSLAVLRPDYGYFIHLDKSYNIEMFYVDVKSGDKCILEDPYVQIEGIDPFKDNLMWYKYNHIDISPDSKSILFLYRELSKGSKSDYLIVMDIESKKYNCILPNTMISHNFWYDNNTVISFCRIGGIDGYYLINIETGEATQIIKSVVKDGHPWVDRETRQIFFDDANPDKYGFKGLYFTTINSDNVVKVLDSSVLSNLFGVSRIDLHPKGSARSRFMLSVDVASKKGRRALIVTRS